MLIDVAVTPSTSESCEPNRVRLNTSRPYSSVPARYVRLGGEKRSRTCIWSNGKGAICCASTATIKSSATIVPPTSSEAGNALGRRGASTASVNGASIADARVENAIQQVGAEVGDAVNRGENENCRLH